MKLGAQLFSLRSLAKTPEGLRDVFFKMRDIGYENVQLSGAGPMEAEVIRDIVDESGLPIVCTHVSYDRLQNEVEKVIEEHRTFGCPVVGLGMMPKQFHGSREGLDAFLASMKVPVARILDAGLGFTYHNHAFEFEPFADTSDFAYDIMLETCEGWDFLMDTYWVAKAGKDPLAYIAKIGGARLTNIHFKDMTATPEREICACGEGVLDFASIYAACLGEGVQHVLVEQDNAVKAEDPVGEMAKSFAHLRPIIK